MIVNESLIPVLKKINFAKRFISLTKDYSDFSNRLNNENVEKIYDILNSFGYKIKYNKSEHFFKIVEKISSYRLQFNISVQRGIVEFIWGVENNGERLKMGGSVCGAIEFLIDDEFTSKPIYSSYEDLKNILKEAFLIYEDFKSELVHPEFS